MGSLSIIIQKAYVGRDGRPLYWAESVAEEEEGASICTALAVIALLRLGYGSDEKRIKDEMQGILEKETDGVWAWDKGLDYPIWTIYNAILMMNEYVLNEIRI